MDHKATPLNANGRLKGIKDATIWQCLTFGWSTNLIWNYGRIPGKITPEILADLHEKDDSGIISKLIEKAWEEEVAKGGKSLWRVLYKVFGRDFIILNILSVCNSIFDILKAGSLVFFIRFLRSPEKPISEGILYTLLLSVAVIFSSAFQSYSFFPASRLGYQIRVGLITLLFRKAINISSSSTISIGKAINLISNDVQTFENASYFMLFMWVGPFQLLLSIIFLWLNIGISSFVAVGAYLLMIPLQSYISGFFGKIRANTVNFRDNRIKLLTDVFGGIEIVKLNTWENPLTERIIEHRSAEYKSLKRANNLKALNQSLFNSSSQIIQFLTFSTLWLLVVNGSGTNLGNKGAFEPENIFPCVSIFASMKLIMTLFLPKAFESYGETKISVRRIEEFLLEPNKMQVKSIEPSNSSKNDSESIIFIKNASFSWKSGTPEQNEKSTSNNSSMQDLNKINNTQKPESNVAITLHNINIDVKKGTLCGIVGPVGSGKSSLCHAILGEMHLAGGELFVNYPESSNSTVDESTYSKQFSKVAYSSQSPWIFGGTIRENILFGYPYEKEWFQKVVFACSLIRDFELFEDGEHTLIGERGATLSGGQRARVSLARAIYTRADLYILDDPLSAVDPKVAKHLFDNVICGLLKDKTRILVTHQLQFIHKSDYVVLLDNGAVIDSGSPGSITKLDQYRLNEFESEDLDSEANSINPEIISTIEEDNPYTDHVDPADQSQILSEPFGRNSGAYSHIDVINDNASVLQSILDVKQNSSSIKKRHRYLPSLFLRFKKTKKIIVEEKEEYNLGGQEKSDTGTTSISTYIKFFKLGASYMHIFFCLSLVIGMVALSMLADFYLSAWSTFSAQKKSNPINVLYYFLLAFSAVILSTATNVFLYRLILTSSNKLMLLMLNSVVYAPMNFFQTQPLGRILNRFSKDQSNIDETLATNAVDTIITLTLTLGTFVFICIANLYLIILVPIILIIFIWIRQLYMSTSRQLKQIESVTRSPVYSLLSETLDGIITVRAFSSQNIFLERFIDAQNENSRAFFSFISAARWLAFRLDMINTLLVILSSFSMLLIRKRVSPSLVALSISYILNLVGMVQWCVRQSIEVEITFISVERNLAYASLAPEESPDNDNSSSVIPASWPSDGKVEIRDLNVQYRSSAKPVLQNITMNISPGEKVGIVGRTGAGKSSFVSSIFRLVEPFPNGCINIDGVNISDLRLNKLRSSISMIPQQPFLFEGSLRFNLDPWEEYSDEQIWSALEAASLKVKVENMPDKLESQVVENGKNFSVGERQLISMCRAILQKKKLVVMDEATANVDLETDKQIQKSVHTHFKDSTVITIAHRLHTIIGAGYDKIAVFDHGKLMEFGHSHELLQNRDSILSKMVADTGPKMEENLRMLASDEWNQKYNKQI
ncbi:hypothetical protein BB561_002172 [Smittium simulii]|uniref:Uncharacterized protein n=1 Tax=Smittium simulii TaxID=133385 RepID=A0A2T9YRJ5_9FUNG|nr:hypothetical protein BB561_002172 [Smittium simulii]